MGRRPQPGLWQRRQRRFARTEPCELYDFAVQVVCDDGTCQGRVPGGILQHLQPHRTERSRQHARQLELRNGHLILRSPRTRARWQVHLLTTTIHNKARQVSLPRFAFWRKFSEWVPCNIDEKEKLLETCIR